jgi:hypothetical protein
MRAMNTFKEYNSVVNIHLHPSRLVSINSGVEEELNTYLLKYNPFLQGFILSYSDVQYNNSTGEILFDRPHINFSVQVKFLVYCLDLNSIQIGIVNRIGVDHISLLLAGVISISINQENIPHYYRYDNSTNEKWLDTRLYNTNELSNIPINTMSDSTEKLDKKSIKAAEKEKRRQAWIASQTKQANQVDNPSNNSNPVNERERNYNNIQVGSRIQFSVLTIHSSANEEYFSISGSLTKSNTKLIPGPPVIIPGQVQFNNHNEGQDIFNNDNGLDVLASHSHDFTNDVDADNALEDEDTGYVVDINRRDDHYDSSHIPKKQQKEQKKDAKLQKKLEKQQKKQERTEAYHKAQALGNNHNNNNNNKRSADLSPSLTAKRSKHD